MSYIAAILFILPLLFGTGITSITPTNNDEIVNFEEFMKSAEWKNFSRYDGKIGKLHFLENGNLQLTFRKGKKLELPRKYFIFPYGVDKYPEDLEGRTVTLHFDLLLMEERDGTITTLPKCRFSSRDLIANVILNTDPLDAMK